MRTPAVRDRGSSGEPKWQALERKEARFWLDQLLELEQLRRRLMRRRRRPRPGEEQPEAITVNTLLRVAVDYLLAHQHLLDGEDEDELRASLLDPDTRMAPRRRTDTR